MAADPQSPWEKLNRLALWQWGLILIFAGIVANYVTAIIMQAPAVPVTAEQKGAALGRAMVTVLMSVTGLVMIVMHFTRKKKPVKRKRKRRP